MEPRDDPETRDLANSYSELIVLSDGHSCDLGLSFHIL